MIIITISLLFSNYHSELDKKFRRKFTAQNEWKFEEM